MGPLSKADRGYQNLWVLLFQDLQQSSLDNHQPSLRLDHQPWLWYVVKCWLWWQWWLGGNLWEVEGRGGVGQWGFIGYNYRPGPKPWETGYHLLPPLNCYQVQGYSIRRKAFRTKDCKKRNYVTLPSVWGGLLFLSLIKHQSLTKKWNIFGPMTRMVEFWLNHLTC